MTQPPPSAAPVEEVTPAEVDGAGALVAVCTYNERENLPELVQRVRAVLPAADVLVVDDDSPDGTGSWAEQAARQDARLRVIVRKNERGLGTALLRAVRASIEGDYRYLLNLDGDLSHDPADLPRLLGLAQQSQPPADVVVGSRYVPGGSIHGWPVRRRVMSHLVNRFATGVLRLPVRDCSGSLRCYRVERLRRLDLDELHCRGYAMLEEILLRLHRSGARLTEVPITFTERRLGNSKLTWGEAARSAAQMVRLAVR